MKKESLFEYNPDLASQWHPTKNGELTPVMVTPGSGKKVWWQCGKGHEWQATPHSRSKGNGCPYCAGRHAIAGETDLRALNPALAAEWHPTKNGNLSPSDVTSRSGKKVWWMGKCGHEWEARLDSRSRGADCPYCAGQKVLPGYNDLATTNPKLAAEWHPTKNGDLTPEKVTVGMGKKVWWKCSKGHEWQATVVNRTKQNSGCPYCSGRVAVVGENDLVTTHPEVAFEWHPTKNGSLLPCDIKAQSNRSVWWLGKCGHEWETKVFHRTRGSGCPYCAGQKVLPGFNDLETVFPNLASQWHPTKNGELTPKDFTFGSGQKVWWICELGHEWEGKIDNRVKGRGCPICDNERKTSFAEQAIFFYFKQISHAINRYQFNGRTEIDVYLPEFHFGIEYDGYLHQTEEAQERDARKNAVLQNADIKLVRVVEVPSLSGCADTDTVIYCRASSVVTYINEIICKLLERLNTFTGQSFMLDVDVERDRWDIYAQYVTTQKENSLAFLSPELAAEWHPTKNRNLLASQVTAGSNKKVWWQCSSCGHEWETAVSHRAIEKTGCPVCRRAQQYITRAKNQLDVKGSLQENAPGLATEWHPTKNGDLTPFDVTTGSAKKVWWRCEQGHEWQASVSSRSKGHGCPICGGKRVWEKRRNVVNH